MDILNRLGINNRTTKRSKFAEFYSLKRDIKSNIVTIENYTISNTINDLISHRMSPRGEASDDKRSFLRKAKDGATNIINKIMDFLKHVKDYIVKKFKQFKEFLFGKKADKVEKATKAATTIINEVIKKDGVVPTNMPNNAWDYMKKQRTDVNEAGQDLSDAKDDIKDSINKRHSDANDYIKETFSKIFGSGGPKTVEVDTIDIPKILLSDGPTMIIDDDIKHEYHNIMRYMETLRYDKIIKGTNAEESGKNQLKSFVQIVGPSYMKIIEKFHSYTLAFDKRAEIESVSVTEKDKLKKVMEHLDDIRENIESIKVIFYEINLKLIRYYDDTMKKIEELKKEFDGDSDFNELYRDITEMNGVLMKNNDKLLKEAAQLLKSYVDLIDKINIKIK